MVKLFSQFAGSDYTVVDVRDLVHVEVIKEDCHGVPGDIVADVVHTEVEEVEVVEGIIDVSRFASLISSRDDFFSIAHSPVEVLEHEVGVVVLAVEEPADGFVDVVDHDVEWLEVVGAVVSVPGGAVFLDVLGGVVDDPAEVAGPSDGLLEVLGLPGVEVEGVDELVGDVFAEVVHSVVDVPESDEGNLGVVVEAGSVGGVSQVISEGGSPGDVVEGLFSLTPVIPIAWEVPAEGFHKVIFELPEWVKVVVAVIGVPLVAIFEVVDPVVELVAPCARVIDNTAEVLCLVVVKAVLVGKSVAVNDFADVVKSFIKVFQSVYGSLNIVALARSLKSL